MTELMTMLTHLEDTEDAFFHTDAEGAVHVTVQDFEGFSEDWDEVERDFVDEDAVDALLEYLEGTGTGGGDFYRYYTVDGVEVVVGWASMDA